MTFAHQDAIPPLLVCGFSAARHFPPGLPRLQELDIYQQVRKTAAKEALPARFRPEIGAKVPGSVASNSLPGDLTNRLPELRKYDSIVTQNVVALVDPATRNVVDVLIA